MKNSEIFKFIERFCINNEELDELNTDLVYAILAHGYLYVKPGKATEKFTLKVIEAFKAGANDGFDNYLEDKNSPWPLDERIRISMARTALRVARKAFNKRYFKKQISHMDPDEACDESLLDKYLSLMSKKQMLDFVSILSYYRAFHMAFTTLKHEEEIMEELHECCRKINPLLPEKAYGMEYLDFRENNPYYMTDYIGNEEFVNAIKREIVLNKSLAGHVARMFYNTNRTYVMESYIALISTYERTFGGDIYKPDIFYENLYSNYHECEAMG